MVSGGTKRSTLKSFQCRVPGCTADLSLLKSYYQRYHVCADHARAVAVDINGVASRFCQACGHFQAVECFEGTTRSCRERLIRHNARRQKLRRSMSANAKSPGAGQKPLTSQKPGQNSSSGDDDDSSAPSQGASQRFRPHTAAGILDVADADSKLHALRAPLLLSAGGLTQQQPQQVPMAYMLSGNGANIMQMAPGEGLWDCFAPNANPTQQQAQAVLLQQAHVEALQQQQQQQQQQQRAAVAFAAHQQQKPQLQHPRRSTLLSDFMQEYSGGGGVQNIAQLRAGNLRPGSGPAVFFTGGDAAALGTDSGSVQTPTFLGDGSPAVRAQQLRPASSRGLRESSRESFASGTAQRTLHPPPIRLASLGEPGGSTGLEALSHLQSQHSQQLEANSGIGHAAAPAGGNAWVLSRALSDQEGPRMEDPRAVASQMQLPQSHILDSELQKLYMEVLMDGASEAGMQFAAAGGPRPSGQAGLVGLVQGGVVQGGLVGMQHQLAQAGASAGAAWGNPALAPPADLKMLQSQHSHHSQHSQSQLGQQLQAHHSQPVQLPAQPGQQAQHLQRPVRVQDLLSNSAKRPVSAPAGEFLINGATACAFFPATGQPHDHDTLMSLERFLADEIRAMDLDVEANAAGHAPPSYMTMSYQQ